MASKTNSYAFRCTLLGHSMDVRAVAVSPDMNIITASRDQTAKFWCEDTLNSRIYYEKNSYKGHTGYVTSVCCIPGTDATPNSFIATGSRDSTILIFFRNSTEAQIVLKGHTDTVSCLAWQNDSLISGSWDHTLKVWKNWECTMNLRGHSGPIWSVAIVNNDIISASADKTLKCWRNGKDIMTYKGHTDCVRGVVSWDTDKFISCSNDASVRLWKISGECLGTFFGHTSFIYSIATLPDGQGFVTSGEDRTIRTWDCNGDSIQTIYLPAQSIWAVAVLPNSDIVAGSSDGNCTVFTQSLERIAEEEDLKQFEESLSKYKVASGDVGGIKKADLPDKSFLLSPGKRDGQTAMVRDDEKILCYNWSATKQIWEAVGEVVGGAGGSQSSSGKVLYLGKEYDYVFDVDLDDGLTLKLPYNKGDDPYMEAQAFIHLNELPQDYLDQVANFIIKNADITSMPVRQGEGFFDPFTGGSRYVPSASTNNHIGTSMETDPFTGSGRYVPNFSASKSKENVPSPYFPQLIPLKFESVNKVGILNKFKEFNNLVTAKLTDDQMEAIVEAATASEPIVAVLAPLEVALQWPSQSVWPVLDVLRLAVRSAAVQQNWLKGQKGATIIALLVSLLDPVSSPAATQLLSLRCLANLACHTPGQEALKKATHSVVGATAALSPYVNKNFEIAAATLAINFSVVLSNSSNLEDLCQVLSHSATIAMVASDSEAIFRSLVAIGTLLSAGGQIKSLAESLDLKTVVEKHSKTIEPLKVGECAKHVLRIL